MMALVSLLMWGCATRIVTQDIHKDSIFKVRLQQVLGNDQQPVDRGYQHPLSLSPEEVDRLLKSIQIEYRSGMLEKLISGSHPGTVRAFSDEEIERMREGFSTAFSTATPMDRIEFQFRHRHSVFDAGLTTGVMYAKDDRIEIIFGNFRSKPLPKGGDPALEPRDPLESMSGKSFKVIAGPYQEMVEPEDSKEKQAFENKWLRVDYRALFDSDTKDRSQITISEPGIEEKLETLKRLRDKELITEEEYEAKKQELLEAL